MRTGYQIYATAVRGRSVKDIGVLLAGTEVASYTEAGTDEAALVRCIGNFPLADGWENHYVKNLITRVIYGAEIIQPSPPALPLYWDDEPDEILGLPLEI